MGVGRQQNLRPGGRLLRSRIVPYDLFQDGNHLSFSDARHHFAVELGLAPDIDVAGDDHRGAWYQRHGFQFRRRFLLLHDGLLLLRFLGFLLAGLFLARFGGGSVCCCSRGRQRCGRRGGGSFNRRGRGGISSLLRQQAGRKHRPED